MKSAVCHSLPLKAAVTLYFRQISPAIRAFLATDLIPPVGCTIGDEEPVSSGRVHAVVPNPNIIGSQAILVGRFFDFVVVCKDLDR
jgi:hypothetical protein